MRASGVRRVARIRTLTTGELERMGSEAEGRQSLRELAAEAVRRTREREGVPEGMPLNEARQIAERAEKREKFRARVAELVDGDYRIEVEQDGERLIAMVEGLRFVESREFLMLSDETHVALVSECPKCRRTTESGMIWKREQLYELIEEFTPSHQHYCSARRPRFEL